MWFPNLAEELEAYPANRSLTANESDVDEIDDSNLDSWMSRGGWYIDGYTLINRSRGHGDSFFKQWLELVQSDGSSETPYG